MDNIGSTFVLPFFIFALIIIIIITIIKSSGSKKKSNFLNQISILTDELERQKQENVSFRNELKRIASQDNLFYASMIRLASRFDPVEIAREAAGLLVNYFNAPEVAVFLLDEKGKRLNIVAQHGLNENWQPRIVYEVGEGMVGITAEKRIPLGNREFEMLRIREPFPIFNPNLCYPLVYQHKIFGVVAITRTGDFEEREKNLLGVVAAITGVALNNTLSFTTLKDVASTDPLTKLYNVGYFRDQLAEELNRAKRFQHELSVAIIDLDNFKYYNDTFGHQAGDQLLIQLAKIFSKHFRDTDVIGRYGGDEFIIMCPETKKSDAAKIMSNLLSDLASYDFARKPTGKKVTFSAGVSSYPEDGTNPSELIKSADKALYEAKGGGRNMVKMHFHKIENI